MKISKRVLGVVLSLAAVLSLSGVEVLGAEAAGADLSGVAAFFNILVAMINGLLQFVFQLFNL